MHAVFLDGVFLEVGRAQVEFHALPRLATEELASVLEDAARRITRYLARRGLFAEDDEENSGALAATEADEARPFASQRPSPPA